MKLCTSPSKEDQDGLGFYYQLEDWTKRYLASIAYLEPTDKDYLEGFGRLFYSICHTKFRPDPKVVNEVLTYWLAHPGIHLKQNIVDFGYLCAGLVEQEAVYRHDVADNVEDVYRVLRSKFRPNANNWMLLGVMPELFLYRTQNDADLGKIDAVLRMHEHWYAGGGLYKDIEMRTEYYNSLVTHPFLSLCSRVLMNVDSGWEELFVKYAKRSHRYAEILERSIAPDGTFPVIGRSATYRFGVFHHLAYACRLGIKVDLNWGSTRSAFQQMLSNFNDPIRPEGGLYIGFNGEGKDENHLAEPYICRNSMYACGFILQLLAIPKDKEFWTDPYSDWTSRRLWSGITYEWDRDESIGDPVIL